MSPREVAMALVDLANESARMGWRVWAQSVRQLGIATRQFAQLLGVAARGYLTCLFLWITGRI